MLVSILPSVNGELKLEMKIELQVERISAVKIGLVII